MSKETQQPIAINHTNVGGITKSKILEDLDGVDGINIVTDRLNTTIFFLSSPKCYLAFYSPKDNAEVQFFTMGDTMPAPILNILKETYEGIEFSIG